MPNKKNLYSLKLQLVDANRVSNPLDNGATFFSEMKYGNNRIVNGIEVDRAGFRNVLQVATDERPDNFRGVPVLSPVVESLKQLSRYVDSELTSSIVRRDDGQ